MEVIGHRGAAALAAENTLESIQAALDNGVDMVEIDLRLQKDRVVLAHDETKKSKKYTSLKQALELIAGQKPVNLEVKEIEVVEKLPEILSDYQGKILISSFHFDVLREVRRLLPGVDIAVLEKWSGVRAVAEASLLNTHRVHVNQQWLWSGFVKSMKHRGYSLYAYVVNDQERADKLREWGVDGVFTDDPSLIN